MPDKPDRDPAGAVFGIVKAGAGAALGAALGGAGLAAQVAAAIALEAGSEEFRHRLLSTRERERVDRVVALASKYIEEQMRLGHELRSDGFFEGTPGNRSIADEIIEGVLLTAQRQYQEKKLPYIAYLQGNIAFSNIGASYANQLIRLADQLSYRQLCLLTLFAAHQRFSLREEDYQQALTQPLELWGLLSEIKDLDDRGLMTCGAALLGLTNVVPGRTRLQGPGSVLYKHMHLSRIPDDELAPLAAMLR